jgi:hypothetical protein
MDPRSGGTGGRPARVDTTLSPTRVTHTPGVEGRVSVASSQQFTNRMSTRRERPEPALITEAEPSLIEQHAARKKRYVITMTIRGISLVLAAVSYQIVWLMVIFAFFGTVLPWIAVVMANDRPPKKREKVNRYVTPAPDRILENPDHAAGHRVIDI